YRIRAGYPGLHDGHRRHLAARLHDGRRFRDRRQADGRRFRRGPASEGILPAAVVDGPCLSPLRTGLGQWRPDRRQFPQGWRQEEGCATRGGGRLTRRTAVISGHYGLTTTPPTESP